MPKMHFRKSLEFDPETIVPGGEVLPIMAYTGIMANNVNIVEAARSWELRHFVRSRSNCLKIRGFGALCSRTLL